MKYFAKYLPVEGEKVQPGDFFFNHKNQLDKWTEDISHTTMSNIPMLRRAKLFLCSRDIQVGDEIIVQSGVKTTATDMDINLKKELEALKVIGEISPDATWVKEGDEFDENDFRIASDIKRLKKGKDFGQYLPPWVWMRCKCCGILK